MKLALYQCRPGPSDVDSNLQRLERFARQAAHSGAQLLVLPEMFLSGYNIGAERVAALAQAADGPAAARIAAIARELGLGILYGYPERDADGRLFNSVQLIDNHGVALANYRKTHLYGVLDQQQFSAADALAQVFTFNGWQIGLLICFDVEFPESVRSLALAGAELVLVPTANMRPFEFVAETLIATRAYENQLFVAYANYTGREGELEYCGLSSVAAPDGQVLSRAGDEQELLLVTLEHDAIAEARQAFEYVRLRRPDLYRS
ncbi:Hydrolase in pqqF 5'region [Pseudomonas sp. 8Z]|uniref:carbon-nitrogen hydrolase family protein n=1 Tax=Pseudomonas sp. 8Z TaxID=2653166 RepID=UPI0012F00F20|nr:carbon-nitrogen hydrolase family protein [Pseudomonas sp. 8Z]VXC27288.1 Hydrolase in pqqF 5'region [Pseudomonas sp. 8Z]